VTLGYAPGSLGEYTYTATQPASGVTENGSFTDGAIKVAARPNGTTLGIAPGGQGVQWATYDSVDCGGLPIKTGAESVEYHPPSNTGQGSFKSLLLTTPATSDQGGAFLDWTGPDSETAILSTNQSICVSQPTGEVTYYVHYSPLQVTKDAATTFTRTWSWTLGKTATPDTWNLFRGDSGTSAYSVTATRTGYTDSDWAVGGSISVQNLLGSSVTINSVSDVVSPDIAAEVSCPVSFPYALAGGATLTCTYSTALPDGSSRTNTATTNVTVAGGSPHGADLTYDISGTADVAFGDPTTVRHGSLTMTDDNGTPGVSSDDRTQTFTDTGSMTYDKTFTCDDDAGTHTNNVASYYDDDPTATGPSADATVTVNCYALEPDKTATASFTRTWSWTIDKSADKSTVVLAPGQSAPVNYTVEVDATFSDGAAKVEGQITVHNPAPMDALLNGVSDVVSGPIVATVDCGVTFPYTLASDDTLTCSYSADLPDATDRTNTATATLQNYSYDEDGNATSSGTTDFSVSKDFSVVMQGVDECATVSDSYAGGPQGVEVCAGVDPLPKTFTYTRTIGPYSVPGNDTVTNTASFVTNDTGTTVSDRWTVSVTVVWSSAVTNSSLCTFDFVPNTPVSDFRLIFTPDTATIFKLNASNPGQFYYNVFYAGAPGASVTLKVPYLIHSSPRARCRSTPTVA